MKRKKYEKGTAMSGIIKNPQDALVENQIAWAKADAEAERNPWAIGVEVLGTLAADLGQSMNKESMALGGEVMKVPVEVEGGEVIETPDGQVSEAKGPDHEDGGIPIELQEFTKVFSKRLESEGKTMAERKLKREKTKSELEKLLAIDGSDAIIKASTQRSLQGLQLEEEEDMQTQELMGEFTKMMYGGAVQSFALGTPSVGATGIMDAGLDKPLLSLPLDPGTIPVPGAIPEEESKLKGLFDKLGGAAGEAFSKTTPGDLIGSFATLMGGIKQKQNTLSSRATDQVNTNLLKGVGDESQALLDKSGEAIQGSTAEAKKALQRQRQALLQRGRSSARGANTQRALDIAGTTSANAQEAQIDAAEGDKIAQLFGKKAQVSLQSKQLEAQGQSVADERNAADKDAFYTARSQNLSDSNLGLQQLASIFNQTKGRNEDLDLLTQLKESGLDANALRLLYETVYGMDPSNQTPTK